MTKDSYLPRWPAGTLSTTLVSKTQLLNLRSPRSSPALRIRTPGFQKCSEAAHGPCSLQTAGLVFNSCVRLLPQHRLGKSPIGFASSVAGNPCNDMTAFFYQERHLDCWVYRVNTPRWRRCITLTAIDTMCSHLLMKARWMWTSSSSRSRRKPSLTESSMKRGGRRMETRKEGYRRVFDRGSSRSKSLQRKSMRARREISGWGSRTRRPETRRLDWPRRWRI